MRLTVVVCIHSLGLIPRRDARRVAPRDAGDAGAATDAATNAATVAATDAASVAATRVFVRNKGFSLFLAYPLFPCLPVGLRTLNARADSGYFYETS